MRVNLVVPGPGTTVSAQHRQQSSEKDEMPSVRKSEHQSSEASSTDAHDSKTSAAAPSASSHTSTWRPRTPEEIRANANLKRAPQEKETSNDIDSGRLLDRLKQRVQKMDISPASKVGGVVGSDASDYFSLVGTRLHSLWRQPSRSEIGTGSPSVTVLITVLASGDVENTRIISPCTIPAVNVSVTSTLNNLERLPSFREYGIQVRRLDIRVVFQVD